MARQDLRIVFAGTPAFAATALSALITAGYNVIGVYTQPDRPKGRGQKIIHSEVKEAALAAGLTVFQPEHFRGSTPEGLAARNALAALNPDVMIVAAYGLILPQTVLDIPRLGCLNIHASLLPRWRGAAPIHRAILAGDATTGITIMQMDAGLDTGDMLLRAEIPILPQDTTPVLHDRLAGLGATSLLQTLEHLEIFQQQRQAQDNAEAIYAHKLSKQEGQIDWQQPARQVLRQINALQPWPVACTTQGETTIRVWQGELTGQAAPPGPGPGTVTNTHKTGVDVVCGDGSMICLTCLQWPNGPRLDAAQIFQSGRLQAGQQLGA